MRDYIRDMYMDNDDISSLNNLLVYSTRRITYDTVNTMREQLVAEFLVGDKDGS